ncbi:GntR family transcriptional regulator (plasmid) [Burkholderia aenigmatica]|uniref:GntR family transcriptional regulator n=1 Tax=Burkholderia aenigmatica TaxID=2015348 RepID=UPI003B434D05
MRENLTSDTNWAYQEIRNRIFNGRLQPGQKISHRGLAHDLDIGQMPVRSALALLAAEGFVTVVEKSGTFVNEPTTADLREIYEVRLALESTAAYLAARNGATPAMDASANQMRMHIETGNTDIMVEQKVGWVFHHEMFVAARNERLYKTYLALRDQTLALTEIPRHDSETVRRGTKEHLEIYIAIRDKNPELARLNMWNHIVDGTDARINLIRAKHETEK